MVYAARVFCILILRRYKILICILYFVFRTYTKWRQSTTQEKSESIQHPILNDAANQQTIIDNRQFWIQSQSSGTISAKQEYYMYNNTKFFLKYVTKLSIFQWYLAIVRLLVRLTDCVRLQLDSRTSIIIMSDLCRTSVQLYSVCPSVRPKHHFESDTSPKFSISDSVLVGKSSKNPIETLSEIEKIGKPWVGRKFNWKPIPTLPKTGAHKERPKERSKF